MMIANLLALGVVLFLLFVFFEVAGEYSVFFIVTNALIIAAAIGFTRCQELKALLDVSKNLDYALWSEFVGLFFGSVIICFCVLVSFFEILDLGLFDY